MNITFCRQAFFYIMFLLLPLTGTAQTQDTPLKVISFDYPPYILTSTTQKGHGLEVDTFLKAIEGTHFKPEFSFFPLKRAIQIQIDFKKNGWPICIGAWNHFSDLPISKDLVPIQLGSGSFFAYSRRKNFENYKNIRKISDLANISVAAPRGSSVVIALRHIGIEPLEVSTFEQLFKILLAGRVDLIIMLDLAGEYHVKEKKLENAVRKIEQPIFEISTDIIIPKAHPNADVLISTLTHRLSKMRTDGELKKIAEKYFGKDQVPKYFWNQRK